MVLGLDALTECPKRIVTGAKHLVAPEHSAATVSNASDAVTRSAEVQDRTSPTDAPDRQ